MLEANILEGMLPEKCPVNVSESRPVAPQFFQVANGDKDGDRPSSPCQLDFGSGFRLVHNSWKVGASLGNGVPSGHRNVMYIEMYMTSTDFTSPGLADARRRPLSSLPQRPI